ncbi:hypothetical protein VP01_2940g1 [Puccinia sorghi]|uniref:Uncharacterized protein n=1 Tax=Puccinia sorghi TaxID=27349 RepID=A0A0L6V1T9_9BASI|nr:hypothetical protein VP01_2940g1 [Puccinia sorghi]
MSNVFIQQKGFCCSIIDGFWDRDSSLIIVKLMLGNDSSRQVLLAGVVEELKLDAYRAFSDLNQEVLIGYEEFCIATITYQAPIISLRILKMRKLKSVSWEMKCTYSWAWIRLLIISWGCGYFWAQSVAACGVTVFSGPAVSEGCRSCYFPIGNVLETVEIVFQMSPHLYKVYSSCKKRSKKFNICLRVHKFPGLQMSSTVNEPISKGFELVQCEKHFQSKHNDFGFCGILMDSYMHRTIITRGGSIILKGGEFIILEEKLSYYKRRKQGVLYCWGCYSWKEGILFVRGGRKEVLEERPSVMVWRLEIISQLGLPWQVPEGFTGSQHYPPFMPKSLVDYY